MDIEMPIKNGYEASYEINEFFKLQNIGFVPIVACSAFDAEQEKFSSSYSGMV